MAGAAEEIRREILQTGPISFERFMELALYHPRFGYYRRDRDPFGKQGDFYTAEQLQPVFGILVAEAIRKLRDDLGHPQDFVVVEMGSGRGEMAEALSEFRYLPVDVDRGEVPDQFTGVVFANEFLDALPVHLVISRQGVFREMLVTSQPDRFAFIEGPPATGDVAAYLEGYVGPKDEGTFVEVNLRALNWLERLARSLVRGYLMLIDYGYTARESPRFPQGTLMSYRRHVASQDVLADPGERDITAHVAFSALEAWGARCGLAKVRFESLSMFLLGAGERDQFARALAADSETASMRRRLQLKTLLYGMGETFRVLLLEKKN